MIKRETIKEKKGRTKIKKNDNDNNDKLIMRQMNIKKNSNRKKQYDKTWYKDK